MPVAHAHEKPIESSHAIARRGDGPRVLIVRPSALGDVCRTVPALVSLRRSMPGATIDWVVNDAFVDAVRHHPDLDEVIAFPRRAIGAAWRSPRRAAEAWRWLRSLRARRYDIAVDLQGLLRSGLITRLTGAKRRVGDRSAREAAWLTYNVRHNIAPGRHTVDHMLAIIEAEGHAVERDMRLYVGEDDKRWLDELLRQRGDADAPYFCLAPTARWLSKCWPGESFIELGKRLLSTGEAGKRVFILASPDARERRQVEPIIAALKERGDVIAPTTTVGQMMAIVSRSNLLVCNDSAPLHVAVGFNRPIVAIFGPTDPALVGPYHRDDSVVRPRSSEADGSRSYYRAQGDDQTLIARVTVDEVYERVEQQLSR